MENRIPVTFRSDDTDVPPPDAQPLDEWHNSKGMFRMMTDGQWHRLAPDFTVTDEVLA